MNGAHSLVQTLLNAGVDTCFANPGTSEMHFVAALDKTPGMRCVLGLQENVVTGMADGYFRVAERPACTLLHCGPGLANGWANLHNARRARSGIVNLVGDQATWHRPLDAPLTADTEGLARAVSAWVRTSTRAAEVGRDGAAAVQAARSANGQVATLVLPSDTCWDEGGVVGQNLPVPPITAADPHAVQAAARVLRSGRRVLLLLSGAAVLAPAQALAPYDDIILVNAREPVGFFGYPGKPSRHARADAVLHVLSRPEQDAQAALQALVDELGAPDAPLPDAGPVPEPGQGKPTPEGLARTLAELLPEQAIVCDESVSFGRGFYPLTVAAAPHDWLHLVGGAIGDGMPLAAGAALAGQAVPGGRRVINLQADGSAMYTVQALWTQARERLPVTTILLNNRSYNILLGEYRNVGAAPGPTAMGMLDLGRPDIDWVRLAGSLGVEAATAHTLEACADLMAASLRQPGPFLIDLRV